MAGSDYALARVRAMEGRLLGAKGLTELLAQPDLAARLDFLKKTDYGAELATELARQPDPLRGAEQGLRRRLADDLVRIDRFLRGERARDLLRAVLAFEDLRSLKTILRGVAAGEAPERVYRLLAPTPGFDDAALRELVNQKDVRDVVGLLASWGSPYALPLSAALESYLRHREPILLEAALDRDVFARALAAVARDGEDGRILQGLLETQIDLANAATLLKLAGDPRAEEFFVPGGRRLGRKRFRRLSRLDERELRQALARLGRLHLDPRLATLGERGDPFEVDELLHRALRDAVRRQARLHPLSLAVALAFVLERQDEVSRVRLILRGTEFGLPADDMVAAAERA